MTRGAKVEIQEICKFASPDQRMPRAIVDRSIAEIDAQFSTSYSISGHPAIPPEFLLRARLLQVFYSIRSERHQIEQLNYHLSFHRFVCLGNDEEVWVPAAFSKNRDWLLDRRAVQEFFQSELKQASGQDLLSEEHFSVDGTLSEFWASQKSFQPKDSKDRHGESSDCHGKARFNETHASVTDPRYLSLQKGSVEAPGSAYVGHVLRDNRHGLTAEQQVTIANGTVEVDPAIQLNDELSGIQRITVDADKRYDSRTFVQDL
jgi:transposase